VLLWPIASCNEESSELNVGSDRDYARLLHRLRGRLPGFVRALPSYYGGV